MTHPPFHLAFPVTDLAAIRQFYTQVLQCDIGRESERWIDFDFFGHQITAHLVNEDADAISCNSVDSKAIPARHFGVILSPENWQELVTRIRDHQLVFYIEPYTRFAGEPGEQSTFFIQDPCENFLEFKSFVNMDKVFQKS